MTEQKKVKIRKPSIVRKMDGKRDLVHKKTRVVFIAKETLRDDFKLAVETNGDTMTDVLTEYMDYYIKQTRKKNHKFDEQMKEIEAGREA